jgi:hypothetical protein
MGIAYFTVWWKRLMHINDVDIEAIKTKVSAFETLIYPDAYFEPAALIAAA